MRKVLLFVVPLLIALIIFLSFLFFMNRDSGIGALQVTANPKSNVYLNSKLIGQTPLCKCDPDEMPLVGEYTLRLVPVGGEFTPFEEKIKINRSVLTVVDRTFGKGANSSSSTITLDSLGDKKRLEVLFLSFPDNAQVLVDNSFLGNTPLLLKNLTESDHEILFKKEGYQEKTLRIRTVAGYKLTAEVSLGISLTVATISATPLASPSASPTPKETKVVILQTPTGFLRVRESGSLGSEEIGRVYEGESFLLLNEKNGWFEIKFKDDKTGWISDDYAQKQ